MTGNRRLIDSPRGAASGAVILFAALMVGGPASARGIAIDQIEPASISSCALGAACSANDFNQVYDYNFIGDPGPPLDETFDLGAFDKVYVYADGVISINKPLPAGASLAGGLASLGSNYIAAGFSDLADLNSGGDFAVVGSVDPFSPPSDATELVAQTVNVEWIFDTPDKQTAILGVSLTDLSNIAPGEIGVSIDSGGDSFTWFGQNYPNAYCDTLCEAGLANDDDGVEGVYLPSGAVIGSGFKGFGAPVVVNSDFAYPGYFFDINVDASAVPEPATWALSILGFALIGRQLRRRRGARLAT
jgi:hypothetical protein